jgi:hypothetical protein
MRNSEWFEKNKHGVPLICKDTPCKGVKMDNLCGAKTRSGSACKNRPMLNGRCRMHGGKSLGGLASPNFIHGRYSKFLPTHLAERYQEAVRDPELLALREEIALVDARVHDLLKRVDTGEAGRLWKEIRGTYAELRQAISKGDANTMVTALDCMEEIIENGKGDYYAWGEVYKLIEQRRRLAESERKRLVAMEQMISTERAMVMISNISHLIRENVTDRAALVRITEGLRKLVGSPGKN